MTRFPFYGVLKQFIVFALFVVIDSLFSPLSLACFPVGRTPRAPAAGQEAPASGPRPRTSADLYGDVMCGTPAGPPARLGTEFFLRTA
ncbi:hypothetical protein [Streptomyces sp. ID05-47C]|uniref:hypothetical protein n=1 Tax=Streptomyces sp. ID05-47C TaxID=3028665 RepID=UPI0029A93BCC|nr:hypothetical protein [Streptomyces sp. ID05-47C]MDX3572242.1 hypothetical protein [Streptomyces sp. ID05-47C]